MILVVPALDPVVKRPFWLMMPTELMLLLLHVPPGALAINCMTAFLQTVLAPEMVSSLWQMESEGAVAKF